MKNYDELITNERGEPIKVLMASHHCCIRVARYGEALRSKGYTIHSMANRVSYNSNIAYNTNTIWQSKEQFIDTLKMYLDLGVDIVHYHNEPHWPAVLIREVINETGSKAKLISDIHDSDLIRRNISPIDELEMFNKSDGIIYVSKPIEERLNNLYKVEVPTTIIYNYPTQSMIDNTTPDYDSDKPIRLVYEGGINPLNDELMNREYKYRDLFPIMKKLVEMGNEVHAYAGNYDALNNGGTHQGIVMYQPTEFSKLLQEMTKFKYNILIFNNPDGTENQVNMTTANKMWDALTAGIPSLACYCAEGQKYVKKHGIGFSFDSLEEIGNCEHLERSYIDVLENIKQKRKELIFERQVWKAENFYATVLGVEKKSIPNDIERQSIFEFGEDDVRSLL